MKPGPGRAETQRAAAERNGEAVVGRVAEVLRDALAKPLSPGLYLVSTPIGNLGDLSLRALAVLSTADLVLCEDTRHTRKLTTHFAIRTELRAYNDHNAAAERPGILSRIRGGSAVALVSDAGTPAISDPGFKLVRAARDEGLAVTTVPGPTAAIAALAGSGLPTDQFFFAGFLPPREAARRRRLEEIAGLPGTLVFYEAPQRLAAALGDMADILGPREAAVAKELTKLHERIERGSLDALAEAAASGEPRGEFVIVVGPGEAALATDSEIASALEAALATQSFRDAVRVVSEATGAPRSRVYGLGLAMTRPRE